MKKALSFMFIFVFCLPIMFLVAACGEGKVVGISLDTSKMSTTFFFDDNNEANFSANGLIVKKVFEDDSTAVLKANEYTVDSSTFKPKTEGIYKIVVKYNKFQESFDVKVVKKTVVTLEVDTSNLPKFYEGDENVDLSNLIVYEVYNDGERKNVGTQFVVDKTNIAKDSNDKILKGTYPVKVSLSSDKTLSITFSLIVLEKEN